jgi:glycosyltransferase involved in cell wall biosynthesis
MTSLSDNLSILVLNKRCWLHPERGGSEINLEETLSRLSKRGHNVQLLTGQFQNGNRRESDQGVDIRRVGFETSFGQPWDDILAYLFVTIYFPIYSIYHSPDVIYTVNTPLPWIIPTRKPTVAIFHHLALDSFFDTHPFPVDWIGYLIQRLGIQLLGDTIAIGVSPATVEALEENGHSSDLTLEIRNGINIDEYEATIPTTSNRVLFVGGLETYKGADRLPLIHQKIENAVNGPVQLDIIGRDGGTGDSVKNYCKSNPRAEYHGFVSETNKQTLLSEAGILIVPSRIEGWGLAVIEANASGTPAVANAVGGLRSSIQEGETGLLLEDYSAKQFAEITGDLLQDDQQRIEMASNAIEWAQQQSWTKSTKRLEKVLIDAVQ